MIQSTLRRVDNQHHRTAHLILHNFGVKKLGALIEKAETAKKKVEAIQSEREDIRRSSVGTERETSFTQF